MEDFLDHLGTIVDGIPTTQLLAIAGDWNVRFDGTLHRHSQHENGCRNGTALTHFCQERMLRCPHCNLQKPSGSKFRFTWLSPRGGAIPEMNGSATLVRAVPAVMADNPSDLIEATKEENVAVEERAPPVGLSCTTVVNESSE